jgi:enterochelin esterase-like enzyme
MNALRFAATGLVCFGMACFSAPQPMRSVRWDAAPAARARCLVVFFPGAGDAAEDFEKEGFVDVFRRRGLSVDLVAANATLGYYFKGLMPEQAHVDVVAPAQAAGYERTWLVGMSMGGFGALFYAEAHPATVDGVLALAPFLGDKALAKDIRDAGGLSKWPAPPKGPVTEATYQRQTWRWLQARTSGGEPGPELNVGWGDDDGLGAADVLLANELPPGHVFHTPGGHDWGPWKALLTAFLRDGTLTKQCAVPP